MAAPLICVIEDESVIASAVAARLRAEGFDVEVAEDGPSGVRLCDRVRPDLVVLDVMLPGMDGLEVCKRVQRDRPVPVLMLTARGEESDKIRGLDTGADDYVTKPFVMTELSARIRALLRRTRPELVEERLEYGDIILDRGSRRVTRQGRNVHLGPTEFRLLDFLMQRPGRVFSRERLLDAVWGANTYVEVRTVDVHVGRLRKALRRPGAPDLIRTVRSAGYALDEHS